MKKWISFALTVVMLLMFSSCSHTKDTAFAKQEKFYYDYLISAGTIETMPSSSFPSGEKVVYDVNKLYYYADDFNYDGIVDLAISAEPSDSNGIEIYTCKNGQVTPLLSNRMPYSAGMEIFTLAKCDGTYGIKYFRKNSVGEFSYFHINADGTLKAVFEGISYDLDGNPLENASEYDKIKPITFYTIDELKEMF